MLDRTKKVGVLSLGAISLFVVFTLTAIAQTNATMNQNFTKIFESIPWFGPMLVGFGLMMCLVVFLLPLIIAVFLCIWLYKDAEKRGKEGILWVILLILATVFLNIIGLILILVVWLVVRPPIQK